MKRSDRTFLIRELVLLFIFAAISIISIKEAIRITNTNRYPSEYPGLFPMLLSPIMLTMIVIAIIGAIKNRPKSIEKYPNFFILLKEAIAEEIPFDVVIMIAAGFLYVYLMSLVGYIISTAVFLIGSILFLARKRWSFPKIILVTIICIACIWLLFFKCFHVLLP